MNEVKLAKTVTDWQKLLRARVPAEVRKQVCVAGRIGGCGH